MAQSPPFLSNVEQVEPTTSEPEGDIEKKPESNINVTATPASEVSDLAASKLQPVPLSWKLMSIVMVTAIGFGSHWSSSITSAMKTTVKKELNINNTQYALLSASEDFMVTVLILFSGIVTDRIGGAGMSIP